MYTDNNECPHQSAVWIMNEVACSLSGRSSVCLRAELTKLTLLLLSIVGGFQTISDE